MMRTGRVIDAAVRRAVAKAVAENKALERKTAARRRKNAA